MSETKSVGQEAAESVIDYCDGFADMKKFGYKNHKKEVASIIDKIVEERGLGSETPLTRELPPTETDDTKRLDWLLDRGRYLPDMEIINRIPGGHERIYTRQEIDAKMREEKGLAREEKTCLEMGADCPVCFPAGYDHDATPVREPE